MGLRRVWFVDEPLVVEETVVARGRPALRAVGDPGSPADPGAFDALYREEWSGLVALGWSLTGSWTAAEELTQDAFADAYRRWDEVAGLDKPGAWVRRALINRSASHHRRRAVESRGLARWSARPEQDDAGADAADHIGDPDFWDAVRSLPARQAECVALHYLEDRPVAEIADILGCKASTVKVHLHRGRTALAQLLAEPRTERTADAQGEDLR